MVSRSSEHPGRSIRIDLGRQSLELLEGGETIQCFSVSTARRGGGERMHSECTPRGLHKIRIKIGAGEPENSVFVGRRPTGEIYTPELGREYPHRDWILTRILWLSGLEYGCNRGGSHDSLHRYIYIHGTPDQEPMGKPMSHGCIRMRNKEIIDLFDMVSRDMLVDIRE